MLVRSPPEIVVTPAVPPVRFADPPDTDRFARVTLEVNDPPVTFDNPVTFPLVRLVVPLVVMRVLSDPPVRFNVPAVIVVPLTDPPVISTVPPVVTFKLFRLTFDVNVPPVTFDRPVTVTPVRSVVLLETIEPKVPPVAINVPDVLAEPMLPAEISAVPAAPTVRLPRFTSDCSNPPVTLA